MAGRGSLAGLLPYSNANDVVVQMAPEILSIVERTPVIAGVCGTDPFKNMPRFLKELQDMGFAGVQNFPTVGLIDGNFRANLEETGMGFALEVDMIAEAHKLGLLTTPYVFTPEDATAMAKAGADVLVAHMGLTSSGTIGAKTGRSLDDCVTAIQAIEVAAKEVKREIIVLCHGGPIAEPADAQYILDRVVGLHGFFGASSMERLPVEKSIRETMEQFKVLPVPKETNFIKHAVEHLRAREEERH